MLNKKLAGTSAYYGINGMLVELYKLYYHTRYALIGLLVRRNQRKKTYTYIL